MNLIASFTSSGISLKFFSLFFGMKTVLIPFLKAAKDFSFSPPISKTFPLRVISPVIATSCETGILAKAEIRAVVNVTPALGPSFGTAPSGTWTWISVESKSMFLIPNLSAFALTYESAIFADSCITSLSCPVSLIPGCFDLNQETSIWSVVPPIDVNAKPLTEPICGTISFSVSLIFGVPNNSGILFWSITNLSIFSPETIFVTILRAILSRFLFNERTPASAV